MRPGLASVILPCYNSAWLAPMALSSLLAQTYPDWECLLVDDGLSDGVGSVVSQADDRRIRLIRLEENRGRGYARGVGQRQAEGEFVALLDADDWWYPWKLEKQVAYLHEHPQVAVLGAGLAIVDSGGRLLGQRCCQAAAQARLHALMPPPLAFAPVCMRTAALAKYPFDPTFTITEDIEWLVRVLLGESYANLGEPLYAYFESNTLTLRKRWSAAWGLMRIWQRHFPDYPLRACWLELATLAKAGPLWPLHSSGAADAAGAPPLSNPEPGNGDEARPGVEHRAGDPAAALPCREW